MEISVEPDRQPENAREFSLGEQIQRITQERGSFTKITEDSLKQEIDSGQDVSVKDEVSEPQDVSFETARGDLAQKVREALNESALSLDFVSLLVSGLRPRPGASSMSPMLKQQVPTGTLSADTSVAAPTPLGPDESARYGWKLMALQDASTYLASAQERLAGEVVREKRFWNEVLDAVNSGEVITRSQDVRRGLSINYGYSDSGSTFFEKGIGSIVRGPDGSMFFRPHAPSSKKLLRVTVYRAGSTEDGPFSQATYHPDKKSEIAAARDQIFEDELFYHLVQEARALASDRVQIIDDKVVCRLYDEIVEIDRVEPEDNNDISMASPEDSTVANAINCGLHLLQCYHFEQKVKLDHEIPPPLVSQSTDKGTKGVLSILRPVLSFRHHAVAMSRALKLVELMLPDAAVSRTAQDGAARSIEALLKPPAQTYDIKAPGVHIQLTVTLGADQLGAVYRAKSNGTESSFHDLTELELWLKWNAQAHSS